MEGREIIIHERRFGPMFFSLVVGALVGAGIGLLVAPQSGVDTRRMIGEKTTQVKDRAVQVVDNTRSKAQDAVTNVRHRLGRGNASVREMQYESGVMEDTIKRTYDL